MMKEIKRKEMGKMSTALFKLPLSLLMLLLLPAILRASGINDPLARWLDDKAPEIVRELPATEPSPEGVIVRRVVFRSREDSEIFACIATPDKPGTYPGLLVLHGGGGSAEVEKAIAWAQRGYVAVAPDLPGIAQPEKMTESKGRWSALKYGEGRWVADPDAGASVIFDAVLSAMKSLYLLRSQPSVDTSRIGVVGISWGGYMTTMVCGLAGDRVKAGFALYGCGFFDRGEYGQDKKEAANPNLPRTSLGRMPEAERAVWFEQLDAGRRVPQMKAAYFLAAATNDFFGYPRAAQATLDAIPGQKNHLYAPNANHKLPVPGGTIFEKKPEKPFVPTPFQPFPTPEGEKANWVSMEVPYFDYHLKGIGQPFPVVTVVPSSEPRTARFHVTAPCPLKKVEIYWAAPNAEVLKRQWSAVPAKETVAGHYEATLPAEAADWFALVSDDRPVSVSSDMVHSDAQ